MTAEQMMNHAARRQTWHIGAWDCYYAICPVTDYADLRESEVLGEDTLDARAIMGEATK